MTRTGRCVAVTHGVTIRALVCAALAASAAPPPSLGAQRTLEIERFDATVAVDVSGSLEVQEDIHVRFQGSWNGIYRSIPVEYRTPQGFSYRLRLKDVSVTGPGGKPYEFTSSRQGHYRRLQIRVPGAKDATREVVISYKVPNGLKFWDEYDELYWNVTGDEWEMPIRSATAMIVLPTGLTGLRTASWTGGYGSREDAATVDATSDGVYFETRQPLDFHEGLTVALAWNPGVIHRPTTADKVMDFLRANWLFVLPLLSLALMWRLWYLRGRDPRRLPVSVQYGPPEELTPSEVGTLVDNRPDMRDLTAALVDLAVRGFLRIEELEEGGILGWFGSKDYRLVPLKPTEAWNDLKAHEREILRGIFGLSPSMPIAVRMSSLQHKFYEHLPTVRSGIFDELVSRGYYQKRPDKTMGSFFMLGFAVLVLALVVGFAVVNGLDMAPLTAILAAVATPLPVFLFGVFMPARTTKGARVMERILGFEEFLTRVEGDRYRRMIDSPQMFERFLPYAMAFGVEKKWAAAFEDLYKEPPSWYVGTWGSGFHPGLLAASMGHMSSTASTAMRTGPRSSGGSGFSGGGGFGGGGFSGGGFGGGGGGGW